MVGGNASFYQLELTMANDYLFTSESVSEGHPDKVADQISDAILDAIFKQDKYSRVAAETLCNTGLVVLAGEITTNAHVDYIQVARDTIKRIGYDNTEYGIDYKGCAVLVAYDKQSNDIAQGVDHASDDVDAWTLRGNNQVDSNRTCKLCNARNRMFYFFTGCHNQVGEFIDQYNNVWKVSMSFLWI